MSNGEIGKSPGRGDAVPPLFAFPEHDPRNKNDGAPDKRAELYGNLDRAIAVMPGNFAAVEFDVDNLRDYNQTVGHDAGDDMLAYARRLLRSHVKPGYEDRQLDEVIAVGEATHTSGDEYWAVLFGISDEKTLALVVGRLVEMFEEHGIKVSAGGHIHKPGETARDVYRGADRALKTGKRASRPELSSDYALRVRRVLGELASMEMTVRDLGYYQERFAEEDAAAAARQDSDQDPEPEPSA